MLEYSLTILTTIISTIGVIMASIFFCCWRKKDAGEAQERKPKLKGEEAAAVVPAAGKPEKGVAAIQSVSQCEMKVPLLSSPALEDSHDDLGDFSAVQRETDILRTYRKPKPPKRTRQSRAPRTAQTDRDSLDVFTQLNEDDSIHGSDKENTDSIDDVDGVLPCQDKRKSQRDTRFSMLADIEQTLADLQVNENSTGPASAGTSPAQNKARLTGPATRDNCKDKTTTGKNNGPELNIASQSENNTSSQHSTVSSEVKTQPMIGKDSPKAIPTAKPRKIPQVSHKPSPKPRSKLEHQDDFPSESPVLEKPSDAQENVSIQQSYESSASDIKRLEKKPQVKFLPQSTNAERRITLPVLLPKVTNSTKKTVSDNKTMMSNGTTHDETNHESTQAVTPTSPVLTESKKCAEKTNSPNTSRSSEENSDIACTTEKNTNDRQCLKDTVANNNRGSRIANRRKDSHPSNKGKSENYVTKGEETGETIKDEVTQIESPKSPVTNSDDPPARISRQTSSDRETSPSQHGEVSRGRSEETRKQRRESNEDQAGKGKISKIPVRAGSKPRSTSPQMLSTDKSSSVDT